MFVRAKVSFETPAHNVAKGQLVDLSDAEAKAAINRGDAVPVSREKAIAEITGEAAISVPSNRTDNPKPKKNDAKSTHRDDNPDRVAANY